MESIQELYKKYREPIQYLIFGVLTTAVNYLSYLVLSSFFEKTTVPTALAWFISVLFAYLTNRKFVFQSKAAGRAALQEVCTFFTARILSGVLDIAIMRIFADWLLYNDRIVKLASNVLVVIFNYIASKLVIFRKQKP